MDRVWALLGEHRQFCTASGELARKRRAQQQAWLWSMIDDGLKRHFLDRHDVQALLPKLEAAVANATITPTEAARRVLALLDDGNGGTRASKSKRTRSA